MRLSKFNQKGFTLVEILIVLVILAVLAGMALPILNTQRTRAYRKEVTDHLGLLREHMIGYWNLQNPNTYAGATFANVGYNPNNVGASGQTSCFVYSIPAVGAPAPGAGTFIVGAVGTGLGNCPVAGDTATINQAGVMVFGGNL